MPDEKEDSVLDFDIEVLFDAATTDESAELRAQSAEIAEQSKAIEKIQALIDQMEQPYVATFLTA